ncbi:RNA methyltransferase [Candidatus Acetothermia bacterium]|nr:RNA methyltransferase [Candidatus Acetothermia bacterium]
MGNLYIGLLHFPIKNRRGEIVATALTSLDVHDIARTSHTYGVATYFVVTPLPSQQDIAWKIVGFWTEGEEAEQRSRRGEALEIIHVAADLDETVQIISEAEGQRPLLVGTSARTADANYAKYIPYEELTTKILQSHCPIYILFGTGWGMNEELIATCDFLLPPIRPDALFNHLSVRAAVAITLDRLLGDQNQ